MKTEAKDLQTDPVPIEDPCKNELLLFTEEVNS